MEELNTQVLRGFALKPRSISKHKLFYICNTDKGTKIIKQILLEPEQAQNSILFQHNIKENLYLQNFKSIDRFNLSVKNEPFYMIDGKTYVVTDHLPYRGSNFANHEEFKRIVSHIATMHSLSKKIMPESIVAPPAVDNDIDNLYNKNTNTLNILKKKISKYKQLSDFDIIFYKNYNYYMSCLHKWYGLIKNDSYKQIKKKSEENKYICHNLLKEEYILINQDNIYITNFFECTYQHYIYDLAAIIKRHFKANTENPLCITEIINTYHISNPLSMQEIEMLYAILIFPDKFINICTQYYTKKRTWIPGTFKARIELTILNKDLYMKYIDQIYEAFLK